MCSRRCLAFDGLPLVGRASSVALGTTRQGAGTKCDPSAYFVRRGIFDVLCCCPIERLASLAQAPAQSLSGSSLDLDDNLALGASLGQVFERFLCLFERKYLIDHGKNAFRLEECANFGELGTVGTYE